MKASAVLRRPIFFRARCGRLPTMSESGCGPPDPDFLRFQENVRITMPYSLEDQSWFPSWRTLWILALLSLVSINANAAQESKSKFNVVALAEVNEDTYSPHTSIKMGDVWTNEHFKARNIYIFMGHHPELFQNASFTTLVTNSIFWAAQQ